MQVLYAQHTASLLNYCCCCNVVVYMQQEGSLCAQHCLNALLQGPWFSPVDLAALAQSLDESERAHMAEAGYGSREFQQFLQVIQMI